MHTDTKKSANASNIGCENAQLVSALNSDDPGTQNIGNVFTNGFPPALVNAAFGQPHMAGADAAAKMVPVGTGSNWGAADCLKRCGVKPSPGGTYVRF